MKFSKSVIIVLLLIFFILGNINFHKGKFPSDLIKFIDEYYTSFIKKEKLDLYSLVDCYLERKSTTSVGQTLEINKRNFDEFYEDIELKFIINKCPYIYEYNLNMDKLNQVYLGNNISPISIGKNYSEKIDADYIVLSGTDFGFLNRNKLYFIKDQKIIYKKKKRIIYWIHFIKNKYFLTSRDFFIKDLSNIGKKHYGDCKLKFSANDKIEILDKDFKIIYEEHLLELIENVDFGFRICRKNPIKVKEFYSDKDNKFALISVFSVSKVFLLDIKKKKIINYYNIDQPQSIRFIDDNNFVVVDNGNGNSETVAPYPANLKSKFGNTRILLINLKNKNKKVLYQGNKNFIFNNVDRVKIDIEKENVFRITEKNNIFILDCREKLSQKFMNDQNCNFFSLIKSPKDNFKFYDSKIF